MTISVGTIEQQNAAFQASAFQAFTTISTAVAELNGSLGQTAAGKAKAHQKAGKALTDLAAVRSSPLRR
jgi:hypothetical protein